MRLARLKRFDVLVTACCLAMLTYFGLHGVIGARGYAHRNQLLLQIATITQQANDITTQRIALEAHVALMRPESIDPDLLDEMARRELFMGKSNDIIIKTSQ